MYPSYNNDKKTFPSILKWYLIQKNKDKNILFNKILKDPIKTYSTSYFELCLNIL